MSKDNITGLPSKQDEMKAAVASLRRNLPDFIEHAKLIAELKRAYYLELIEQGFTNEEALEMAKGSILL